MIKDAVAGDTKTAFQGLIGSRPLALYHPDVRHRPSHDLESFIWIFLQMLLQYSPSIKISNYGIADGVLFKTERRAALVGFDDMTSAKDSFVQKRALLSSSNIRSTVPPLRHALYQLLALMEGAARAFTDCNGKLRALEDFSADEQEPALGAFDVAKAQADQARLSYARVLTIFGGALKFENWPKGDAAVDFQPNPQCEASPAIVTGYRTSAQRSTQMASVKRNHDQSKEEGDDAAEGGLVLKKRKQGMTGTG